MNILQFLMQVFLIFHNTLNNFTFLDKIGQYMWDFLNAPESLTAMRRTFISNRFF